MAWFLAQTFRNTPRTILPTNPTNNSSNPSTHNYTAILIFFPTTRLISCLAKDLLSNLLPRIKFQHKNNLFFEFLPRLQRTSPPWDQRRKQRQATWLVNKIRTSKVPSKSRRTKARPVPKPRSRARPRIINLFHKLQRSKKKARLEEQKQKQKQR